MMAESKSQKSPKEVIKRLRLDPEEYALSKRLPNYLPKRDNHIYVNMNSNFKIQLNKCQELIDSQQFQELFIHGLGKAVNRSINMSLQLKNIYGLDMSCNTSSVDMIDDLEPIGPNRNTLDAFTQTRTVSAIHIRLYRKSQTTTSTKQ